MMMTLRKLMVRRLVMKRKRAVKEGGELFGKNDSDDKLSS